MPLQPLSIPKEENKRKIPHNLCNTPSKGYEPLLESLLGSLLTEDKLVSIVPDGAVLDVGALFGDQACHFAKVAPDRTVYTLDPTPSHYERIVRQFGSYLPNLKIIRAGIGLEMGEGNTNNLVISKHNNDTFPIVNIDHLFYEKNESLGLAHIDVDGVEFDTLKGGFKTIQKDRPVITVELRVHENPKLTKDMLDYITNVLKYDVYVVDEPCGWPHMDYRNLLLIPRKTASAKLEYSDAFNLAFVTNALFRVDSETIFELVYPCCRLGGECCKFNSTKHKRCCGEQFMQRWHKKNGRKAEAIQGFTYSKRYIRGEWGKMGQRSKVD